MPSPIGHAIAGAAIAWGVEATPPRPRLSPHLPLICACLAAAPDLDLLAPYMHRTVTHSLLAVAVVTAVMIIGAGVTAKVTGRVTPFRGRFVLACAAAYASHLLLDWLGVDDTPPRGLQILWPFSDRWFISDLDVFRGTARLGVWTAASMWTNALAIVQEIAILGPIALLAWFAFRRSQVRVAGGDKGLANQ